MAAVARDSYDVVVVGAGGAGMTAALAAHHRGLATLLIESTEYFGGTTARSGGGVWIPNNHVLQAAGQRDDPETARTYLRSIIGDVVDPARIDAFIEHGPASLRFITEHSDADFMWVPQYSDYYPEAPGGKASGRSIEPRPLDGKVIGAELDRLFPSYTKAPVGLVVTQADFRKISLGMRTVKGPITMAKVLLK
ncbi:MAG: FAD-dependent oxidoreductase, partial [Actinomycetota bacterium]|nr:FAD-dependent oxidoreductase [Actinomycetota bacterium]